MKINLGCGTHIIIENDWINVDIRALAGVDKVIHIEEIDKHFEPDSIEHILANDIIEHFGHLEVNDILIKLHKILKPGGTISIRVPDALHHCFQYMQGKYTADELSYWLYGGQDYLTNFHKMCFDYESLYKRLKFCGFSAISHKESEGINFRVTATK